MTSTDAKQAASSNWCFIILLAAALSPALFPADYTSAIGIVFLTMLAILGLLAARSGSPVIYLLSPTPLVAAYILLSLGLGAYGIENGLGFILFAPQQTSQWPHYRQTALYTAVALVLILFVTENVRRQNLLHFVTAKHATDFTPRRRSAVVLGLWLLGALVAVRLLASNSGVLLNVSVVPLGLIAVGAAWVVAGRAPVLRMGVYGAVFVMTTALAADSKREGLLLLLLILQSEYVLNRTSVFSGRIRGGLAIVLVPFLLLITVLTMSILRGYGQYGASNIFEAILYIDDYVSGRGFLSNLFANFELSAFYFMHFHSMEQILSGAYDHLFGSTYWKAAFIFVPQSVWKPQSMVAIWTNLFAPGIFEQGKSLPISFISESMWNFSWLGLSAVGFIAWGFERVYGIAARALLSDDLEKYMLALFVSYNFVLFSRGSGLEIVAINAVIAAAILIPLSVLRRVTRLRAAPNSAVPRR